MTTMNLPTYVSISEATQRYRLSRETLTYLVETGKVRAVEVNGSVAVAEEDVSAASASGLPTYISIPEAVDQYDLEREILTRLVEAGRVRAIKIDGSLVVAVEDVEEAQGEVSKRDQLWDRVQQLDGHAIGVREAAEKYDLSKGSLSRWIKAGYIRTLSKERPRGRGQKRLLNEADVAYASLLANEYRRGREVFRSELIPKFAR